MNSAKMDKVSLFAYFLFATVGLVESVEQTIPDKSWRNFVTGSDLPSYSNFNFNPLSFLKFTKPGPFFMKHLINFSLFCAFAVLCYVVYRIKDKEERRGSVKDTSKEEGKESSKKKEKKDKKE